jgi:hypothetical protein
VIDPSGPAGGETLVMPAWAKGTEGYSWAVLPSPVERDPVLSPYLVELCPVVPSPRADRPSAAAR